MFLLSRTATCQVCVLSLKAGLFTYNALQAMYQIGDNIQQAWLVGIQPMCVLLDRGGQEETLCLSNNEPVENKRQHRTARQPVSSHAPDNADARPLRCMAG